MIDLSNGAIFSWQGPVKFDKNGDRETVIQILQAQGAASMLYVF